MGPRAERLEKRLDVPMLIASALVIPDILLEVSSVGGTGKAIALGLNWATWLAFAAELVVMLAVVRSRRDYLAHNPVRVITVVFTPPFLATLLQSLRLLRLLRLVRLLRLLRLAPIFRRAFTLQGFKYATVFTGLVAVTGAAAFAASEPGKNYLDGIYWAVSTMTTVGYGDELPTTVEAKIVAMTLMVVGIGYFAIVTGAIADRFFERGQERHAEAIDAAAPDDLTAQVDRLVLRATELAAELEALRAVIPPRGG
jgi:voltage-gated potassium channel